MQALQDNEFIIKQTKKELEEFLPIEVAARDAFHGKKDFSVDHISKINTDSGHLYLQAMKNPDSASAKLLDIINIDFTGEYDRFTLRQPLSSADETPLHITKHVRYLPPRKHVHNFFEFFYILQGSCKHICDNQSYTLKEGDLCFWQYDIPHMIISNSDDLLAVNIMLTKSDFSRHFSTVLQQQSVLESYFSRILYGDGESPMVIFHTKEDEMICYLICRMYQEYKDRPIGWQASLTSSLSFLLVRLLREHSGNISTSSETDVQDQSLKLLQYIQNHYETLTFEDLCDVFNYAPAYLSRLIHRKTGMTFSQIIARQRLEQGAWLLTHTDLGIGQIASRVGYADAGYFSRLFRAAYGMLPREYRQNALSPLCDRTPFLE